jgi:thiaminase (transcriptional activator TenA)
VTSPVDDTGFSAQLRRDVSGAWEQLCRHPFVVEMADGSLDPRRYLFYIEQNLLYLPEYARAIALGVAKTTDSTGLEAFTDSLVNIVATEIPQNRLLRDRVRALVDDVDTSPVEMAPATLAYSSYLLSTASLGDERAIRTLILPCAWSYGDIAGRLADQVVDHPVYSEWFRFFASPEYGELVREMRAAFDADTADCSERERSLLAVIFGNATRLERQFWDMGYHQLRWPS